jgi:hypothetical protein
LSRASLILKQPRSDLCSRTPIPVPRPSRGLGWAGNGRSCRFFRAASSGRGAAAR